MHLHRLYVGELHDKRGKAELTSHIWINVQSFVDHIVKGLSLNENNELILFDDEQTQRLYRIEKIEPNAVGLRLVTEIAPTIPKRHIYLFWYAHDKAKDDSILQEYTRLGVRNFIPLLNPAVKTEFDYAAAQKLLIEAVEQSQFSTIPKLREPINLDEALTEYEQNVQLLTLEAGVVEPSINNDRPIGIILPPLEGWNETNIRLLSEHRLQKISSDKEPSAVALVARLLQ